MNQKLRKFKVHLLFREIGAYLTDMILCILEHRILEKYYKSNLA